VAGRDRGKLERLVASLSATTEGSTPPSVVVADVNDSASLLEMARCGVWRRGRASLARPHASKRQLATHLLPAAGIPTRPAPPSAILAYPLSACSSARVLINTVGPFRYWGEPVVKACVEAGTHYLDVCGEPGANNWQ
jgi:hypothetical protein